MSAHRGDGEIPLLLSFFYLLDGAEAKRELHFLDLSPLLIQFRLEVGRSESETASGWEFGWGGTSVKG